VRSIAAAEVDVVRTALLRLRDRYDQLILPENGRIESRPSDDLPVPDQAVAATQLADSLRRGWEDSAASGRRRLQALRRAALAPELHASLGRWLELVAGQEVAGWTLAECHSSVPFGDHPNFGIVTILAWRHADGHHCRVAVGPILGEGRSMPKDLEVKLSALTQRPPLAEQLVVLWPLGEGTIAPEQLPPASRQIWDQRSVGRAVALCPLLLTDFAWLLGFPEWLAAQTAAAGRDELRAFVLERTEFLLRDLVPRLTAEVAA
jgi:hypothetical protein